MTLGSFFGVGENKRRSRVHRKRVARIKHGGRQGCNSDKRERSWERKEYDGQNRERSSEKNRHVINGCWKLGENECRTYWGDLRKPRRAYMYTVHIRIRGGEFCEKLKPRKPFQHLSLLRFARLKTEHRSQ